MNNFVSRIFKILFLLLSAVSTTCYAQTAYIQHFNIDDGLPSNSCNFTMQDAQGYIWIATDAGVSRFDGKLFKNFSIDDGLPDNQILQIKQDSKGRVWFLSFNGKLSYFLNGKIYNDKNDKLLRLLKFDDIVVSFYEDSKGQLWFGSNKNRLCVWDGRFLTRYTSKDKKRLFMHTFIHEDPTGTIWAINDQSTVYLQGNVFRSSARHIDALSYKTISNLPNRDLVYLNSKGLNGISPLDHQLISKVRKALLNEVQGFMYVDSTTLWLSSNSGIYEIAQDGHEKQLLKDIPATQVIKDRSNNMWFATAKGIYMLPAKKNRMYVFDEQDGLTSNYVKSITADKFKNLWLGLDNASINVIARTSHSVRSITLADQQKFGNIKQLYYDKAEEAMFVASDYGLAYLTKLYAINPDKKFLKERNNTTFAIKSFSLGKNDELALATSAGVIILKDYLKTFMFDSTKLKSGQNLFLTRAYKTFYTLSGKLWFSNSHGIQELIGVKLTTPSQASPFFKERINDIIELQDGTIVLATDGFGLLFVKNDKLIKRLTIDEGLSDNICKKLFVRDDHLWVSTNNGINRICADGKYLSIKGFEFTNPLLRNDINEMYIGRDTAFFATNTGLVYFAIDESEGLNQAPRPLISSIVSNKEQLDTQKKIIVLAPSRNNITFYYSAIDFQNQNITYRYRLDSTENWTETKIRRLEFSSLTPGSYVFEVSAKTNNTQWGKSAKMPFTIKAHFWEKGWFIFVLIAAASFTCYKIAVVITKWQKNQEQKQLLLKNKILMLEQRALQAMMNPHFIFNVMNSIQHYINTKDTSSANKVLTGFARLIRKNLEICTKSYISLEEELEYLNLYLALEKKRFGNRFNYALNIDPKIDKDETMIPSMLLQPYIENAIWHGIMPKEDGGNVFINMELSDDDHLLISIIDDGVGIENSLKTKKDKHISKGMNLTQERINLLNQVEAIPIQIEIKQRKSAGTEVCVNVPIH